MVGHVGLAWFGRNSEAEFRTVNESMNELMNEVGTELLGQLKSEMGI